MLRAHTLYPCILFMMCYCHMACLTTSLASRRRRGLQGILCQHRPRRPVAEPQRLTDPPLKPRVGGNSMVGEYIVAVQPQQSAGRDRLSTARHPPIVSHWRRRCGNLAACAVLRRCATLALSADRSPWPTACSCAAHALSGVRSLHLCWGAYHSKPFIGFEVICHKCILRHTDA